MLEFELLSPTLILPSPSWNLFKEQLRPVNLAQAAVPLPEGLDLDVWISREERKSEENGGHLGPLLNLLTCSPIGFHLRHKAGL